MNQVNYTDVIQTNIYKNTISLSEGCPLNGVIFFLGAMALGGRGFGSGRRRRRRLPASREGPGTKKGSKNQYFTEKMFP